MKGDIQLCQTSVSFKLLPANDQACADATSGSGSTPASITPQVDSSAGTVYFPAANVVVVNPAIPQGSLQPILQARLHHRLALDGTITRTLLKNPSRCKNILLTSLTRFCR